MFGRDGVLNKGIIVIARTVIVIDCSSLQDKEKAKMQFT